MTGSTQNYLTFAQMLLNGVRVRKSTGDNGWMGNTRLRMEYPNLVYQAFTD